MLFRLATQGCMKILYLAELLTDGGTAKHLAELLPRLRDEDIEPVVWSRGAQGRYASLLRASGVALEALPALERPLLSPSRTAGFDLVHSYLYGAHLSDALICFARGLPYLKSTRNTGHWFTDRIAVRARVAVRSRLIRHHVVNSSGVADYLVRREGVDRKSIAVIHNGMLDRYEQGPFLSRRDIGLAETDFVLLSVAWLKQRKSIDFLVRSVAALLPEFPRIKLVLAGDGPEEANLRKLAASLGAADACRFLGRQRDAHALARIADVCVSASCQEGMSNSSIEAQMMGLPVVACAEAAGNADIVESGVNGYLYRHGDEAGFRTCIATLCSDEKLLQAMRQASRRVFLERFTMDAQLRGYVDLYRRIVV
jgi:glycosyltransferase involved in cell wall biosynthesis